MTEKEFIKEFPNTEIDDTVVNRVEGVYGKIESTDVKKILSYKFEDYFLESDDFLRALSLDEILDAKDSLHVDFPAMRIIPLFDVCDGDFVVYQLDKNVYSYMNINNLTLFSETDNIVSLL
jgi:hypothetical protein